jgi:hypothetical protein
MQRKVVKGSKKITDDGDGVVKKTPGAQEFRKADDENPVVDEPPSTAMEQYEPYIHNIGSFFRFVA